MPSKKRRANKPHGHFCYVCGEHKANEKFSGKGHARHICRKCQSLPVEKRNEMIAVRKAYGMAFRHISEAEIKWLRGKMDDPRPEVSEAAREAHSIKFPRYERNKLKKGLTARSLEFYIHGEVLSEFGDDIAVHMRFVADNTGALRRIDYSAEENKRETAINIGQPVMIKFLKAVVHQLDAPFWSEDLSDEEEFEYDPYIDILPGYRPDFGVDAAGDDIYDEPEFDDMGNEPETSNDGREPLWSLKLMLTKGIGEKTQVFYNQMHDRPQELFWSLMDLFEPDSGEADGYDYGYNGYGDGDQSARMPGKEMGGQSEVFEIGDKGLIEKLNAILGTDHRSKPYKLSSDEDLKQALLYAVAEYRDYCNYCGVLGKVSDDFDESLEYYDPASWFNLGKDPDKSDALALECAGSLNDAIEKFHEIAERSKGKLDVLLRVALTAPSATQRAVLGNEYNIDAQNIDAWLDELFISLSETEYHYEMDKNLETLLALMKDEFQ